MEPTIQGRRVAWENTTPWLNIGANYRHINDLVTDAEGLQNGGYTYDRERSHELITDAACYVFHGPGPDVILCQPVNAHAYSDRFYRERTVLMQNTEEQFL
jgi:hypothetical protein